MNTLLFRTPCDILLDGNRRLGPKLLPLDGGREYEAIYGFSGKQAYDLFCANSDLALTPYPLVSGYLKDRIAESDVDQLVVLDAAGPREIQLYAATMNAVLKARIEKSNEVTVSFRLTFNGEQQAYHVEKEE